MRKQFQADLFLLTHDKLLWFLLLFAIPFGFFFAGMMKGILLLFQMMTDAFGSTPIEGMDYLTSTLELLQTMMSSDYVFLSSIPFSEGYALVASVAVCLFATRPFTSGTIRNRIASGVRRTHIYASTLLICFLYMTLTMLLYYGSASLASILLFGSFSDSLCRSLPGVIGLSLLICLVYVSGYVMIATETRNTVVTILIGILLPIGGNLVFSVLSATMNSAPDWLIRLLSIFPSFQSMLIVGGYPLKQYFLVALLAGIAWIGTTTTVGFLKIRKVDLK